MRHEEPAAGSIWSRFSLAGKTALVTGSAGPLGSAFARTLAELGARVVVSDRDQALCEATVATLPAPASGFHLAVAADLLQRDAWVPLIDTVGDELNRLDVLVNNAAFTGTSGVPGYAVPFEAQTADAFEAAMRLNLLAPFALAKEAAPLLAASGGGSIVNIASIYGIVGPNLGLYEGTTMGNPAAYGATKGGIIQLTRYLATVLAPSIRVNTIAPGGIERGQDAEFQNRYSSLTPLRRMATEADMCGALAWLATDASAYVTGQLVAVDGGWTAW